MNDLNDIFRGRRVLITGHTGFKGSWLALWLDRMGAEVIGFAKPPEYARSHFELLDLASRIDHREGDIRDAEALRQAIADAQPEIVFHLAAQALVRRSYADPKTTFDTNLGGSVNLLEAVRDSDTVKTLVFITSDKCYLNKEWVWGYRENDELGGHDPYSASKAAAEMAFLAYRHSYFSDSARTGVASARAGNVIGGGDWAADRIIPDCIRALEKGEPIVLRNPAATRPWQHVLEPLHGYLRLAAALLRDPARFTGSWNFGPELNTARTVSEVAETAADIWGGGRVVVETPKDAPMEHQLLQLNIDKAKLDLQWTPRWDSDRAVRETITWYRRVLDGEAAWDVSGGQVDAFCGTSDD